MQRDFFLHYNGKTTHVTADCTHIHSIAELLLQTVISNPFGGEGRSNTSVDAETVEQLSRQYVCLTTKNDPVDLKTSTQLSPSEIFIFSSIHTGVGDAPTSGGGLTRGRGGRRALTKAKMTASVVPFSHPPPQPTVSAGQLMPSMHEIPLTESGEVVIVKRKRGRPPKKPQRPPVFQTIVLPAPAEGVSHGILKTSQVGDVLSTSHASTPSNTAIPALQDINLKEGTEIGDSDSTLLLQSSNQQEGRIFMRGGSSSTAASNSPKLMSSGSSDKRLVQSPLRPRPSSSSPTSTSRGFFAQHPPQIFNLCLNHFIVDNGDAMSSSSPSPPHEGEMGRILEEKEGSTQPLTVEDEDTPLEQILFPFARLASQYSQKDHSQHHINRKGVHEEDLTCSDDEEAAAALHELNTLLDAAGKTSFASSISSATALSSDGRTPCFLLSDPNAFLVAVPELSLYATAALPRDSSPTPPLSKIKPDIKQEQPHTERVLSKKELRRGSPNRFNAHKMDSMAHKLELRHGVSEIKDEKVEKDAARAPLNTSDIPDEKLYPPLASSVRSITIPVVVGGCVQLINPESKDKSHRWTVYLRGLYNGYPLPPSPDAKDTIESSFDSLAGGKAAVEEEKPSASYLSSSFKGDYLSQFIHHVTFILDSSFVPCVRTIYQAPFEITEEGWGEFVVSIHVHLRFPLDTPGGYNTNNNHTNNNNNNNSGHPNGKSNRNENNPVGKITQRMRRRIRTFLCGSGGRAVLLASTGPGRGASGLDPITSLQVVSHANNARGGQPQTYTNTDHTNLVDSLLDINFSSAARSLFYRGPCFPPHLAPFSSSSSSSASATSSFGSDEEESDGSEESGSDSALRRKRPCRRPSHPSSSAQRVQTGGSHQSKRASRELSTPPSSSLSLSPLASMKDFSGDEISEEPGDGVLGGGGGGGHKNHPRMGSLSASRFPSTTSETAPNAKKNSTTNNTSSFFPSQRAEGGRQGGTIKSPMLPKTRLKEGSPNTTGGYHAGNTNSGSGKQVLAAVRVGHRPNVVALSHLLRFSHRQKPSLAIPPLAGVDPRRAAIPEHVGYVLVPEPVITESYDEIVIPLFHEEEEEEEKDSDNDDAGHPVVYKQEETAKEGEPLSPRSETSSSFGLAVKREEESFEESAEGVPSRRPSRTWNSSRKGESANARLLGAAAAVERGLRMALWMHCADEAAAHALNAFYLGMTNTRAGYSVSYSVKDGKEKVEDKGGWFSGAVSCWPQLLSHGNVLEKDRLWGEAYLSSVAATARREGWLYSALQRQRREYFTYPPSSSFPFQHFSAEAAVRTFYVPPLPFPGSPSSGIPWKVTSFEYDLMSSILLRRSSKSDGEVEDSLFKLLLSRAAHAGACVLTLLALAARAKVRSSGREPKHSPAAGPYGERHATLSDTAIFPGASIYSLCPVAGSVGKGSRGGGGGFHAKSSAGGGARAFSSLHSGSSSSVGFFADGKNASQFGETADLQKLLQMKEGLLEQIYAMRVEAARRQALITLQQV